jgi:uncharacterized membrane protein (UPF0182 family)
VDQHAVVQHCPLRGGLPGGFHRAVGGSCAGLHCAGVRRRDFRFYSRLVTVGLGVVALLFGSASIDYWTIMRFFGSRGMLPPDASKDKVFSRALPFYLFDLPFYSEVLGFVLALAIICALRELLRYAPNCRGEV